MLAGGLGTAVAIGAPSASAHVSHTSLLPPVNVAVTNQPTVNIGNQPTVNVNTPTQSPRFFYTAVWSNGNQLTPVNISGSGKILSFEVTSMNGQPVQTWLYADGTQAWYEGAGGGCCWINTPAFGWTPNAPYGGGPRGMYYSPPTGVGFQHNFQIVVDSPNGSGWIGVRGMYTLAS
jgi:hypothetical protein